MCSKGFLIQGSRLNGSVGNYPKTYFSTIMFNIVSSFLGVNKETPIVTPLMEYVRQKRTVDSGVQVMILSVQSLFAFSVVSCLGYPGYI